MFVGNTPATIKIPMNVHNMIKTDIVQKTATVCAKRISERNRPMDTYVNNINGNIVRVIATVPTAMRSVLVVNVVALLIINMTKILNAANIIHVTLPRIALMIGTV